MVNRQENSVNTLKLPLRQKQRHTRLHPLLSRNIISSAHSSAFFSSTRINTNHNSLVSKRWIPQFFTLGEKIIQIHKHHDTLLQFPAFTSQLWTTATNRHKPQCSTDS